MYSLYVALFGIFNIYVYSFCVAYAYTGQQIDRGNEITIDCSCIVFDFGNYHKIFINDRTTSVELC